MLKSNSASKGVTQLEAAREWVKEFNAIPTQMIAKLWNAEPENWREVTSPESEGGYYDMLPMWGTMWSFGNSTDADWLIWGDGINKMSKCGFRIFESEEFGYFFGIDGEGYDFYEAHWLPLYKARGLRWHDTETEDAGE